MKRLLLTARKRLLLGALVALFSFAGQARAQIMSQNEMVDRVLTVAIIGTTKERPRLHVLQRITLPYETRHTCEEAQDRLDVHFILKAAKAALKNINVVAVQAGCRAAGFHI